MVSALRTHYVCVYSPICEHPAVASVWSCCSLQLRPCQAGASARPSLLHSDITSRISSYRRFRQTQGAHTARARRQSRLTAATQPDLASRGLDHHHHDDQSSPPASQLVNPRSAAKQLKYEHIMSQGRALRRHHAKARIEAARQVAASSIVHADVELDPESKTAQAVREAQQEALQQHREKDKENEQSPAAPSTHRKRAVFG